MSGLTAGVIPKLFAKLTSPADGAVTLQATAVKSIAVSNLENKKWFFKVAFLDYDMVHVVKFPFNLHAVGRPIKFLNFTNVNLCLIFYFIFFAIHFSRTQFYNFENPTAWGFILDYCI